MIPGGGEDVVVGLGKWEWVSLRHDTGYGLGIF